MSPPAKSRFWRRARVAFRWLRIVTWLLLLVLICFLLWLNRVGLPDFLKNPLVAQLRQQGVEVEFSRIRLRWYRGIVAEDVHFAEAGQTGSPRLTGRELVLRLDVSALWHRKLELRGLALSDGRLTIPVTATNAPAREVCVEQLQTQVDFQPGGRWQLSSFEGRVWGIDFQLAGTAINVPALLQRKPMEDSTAKPRTEAWNRFLEQMEKVTFTPVARLKGTFSCDGKAMEASTLHAEVAADQFKSPWASGRDLALVLDLEPTSNAVIRARAMASARHARTPWGQGTSLRLAVSGNLPVHDPQPRDFQVRLEGDSLNSLWGRAQTLRITARTLLLHPTRWTESAAADLTGRGVQTTWASMSELGFTGSLRANPTNSALVTGAYEFRGGGIQSRWIQASNAVVQVAVDQWQTNLWAASVQAHVEVKDAAVVSTNTSAAMRALAKTSRLEVSLEMPPLAVLQDTNTTWLAKVERMPARFDGAFTALKLNRMIAEELAIKARWRAPELAVESLTANLHGGQIWSTARLDVVSRECQAALSSDADLHGIALDWTTNARDWRTWIHWDKPPHAEFQFRMVLPHWTNAAPDWMKEVLPTTSLSARFASGPGALRSIPFVSVRSEVTLTNLLWAAHQVDLKRPEGSLLARGTFDSRARDFTLAVTNSLDPQILRPVLEAKEARQALDYFKFSVPPRFRAVASGRWGDWSGIGGQAWVALTNLTFRDQAMKSCVAEVGYTNLVLDVFNARVEREEGVGTADRLRVDFKKEVLLLTNVQSGIDAMAFARAVGPHVVKRLQPYQFSKAPKVHFEGAVGLHGGSGLDDARFEVDGGPFEWQRFKFSHVKARLHWLGDTLTITNFDGAIKGGSAVGNGFFDFSPAARGTEFRFDVIATNVNAMPLLTDLFPASTNRLEGLISGRLVVTNATTEDMRSWQGHGDVNLQNGLIWDVPVFKVFSPMLNKVVPGLGNSRARSATATFNMTNSVMATRDMEVHATGMRMQFDGTVDFDGNLNGRVEAELLRDTPGLGWLVSKVLWPVTKVFEYRITGTLGNPKTKPLFIPKALLAPFHPLRTLKELFGDEKKDLPEKEEKPDNK